MKKDNSFETMTITLLIIILLVVTHSNLTMREEIKNNANQQTSESIMNDEEITSRDVNGEADLGEPESTADLQTEENEEGLSEPEGAGLNDDNAQRTSEEVGEKVGEVLGQLGDGFRNVIETLDDKLNDE